MQRRSSRSVTVTVRASGKSLAWQVSAPQTSLGLKIEHFLNRTQKLKEGWGCRGRAKENSVDLWSLDGVFYGNCAFVIRWAARCTFLHQFDVGICQLVKYVQLSIDFCLKIANIGNWI